MNGEIAMNEKEQLHDEILEKVREYCDKFHNVPTEFREGQRIPYASRIYDSEEMVNLVDSALEFWLKRKPCCVYDAHLSPPQRKSDQTRR